MKKYKAVIFDMDGTLLDTLTDLRLSLNHGLRACGYAERSMDEVQSYIGDGMSVLIARALPDELKHGVDCRMLFDGNDGYDAKNKELIDACVAVGEEFKNYYIDHGEDNTRPYDGILPLLEGLKSIGIKTAVVSNKMQAAVDRLNERLFGGLIDVAIGDGNGIRLKPTPDMLIYALSQLGVDRSEAIFVGDGDTDIIAAKDAGLPCISVCYGYRTEEFLREHGGRIFAHNASELAGLLGIEIA